MKYPIRIHPTSFVLGAITALMMLPLRLATAQGRQEAPPQINVSGSAEVKVAPDEVDLSVGVETRNESLEEAKRQNDQRISKALEFLQRNGVKDKEVQTDYISIEPVYDPTAGIDPRTGLPLPGYDKHKALVEPAYYLVRKSIGLKLIDLSKFDMILSGLVSNGVNHVQRTEFRTSELRKHKDKARAMAVQAAKEKAEAMAAQLGVKLGKPYNINVNDWSGWSPQASWGLGGGGGYQNVSQNVGGPTAENGPTIAVGQISVSANVSVSFLIE
jgi:hypothetical protein